jgi:hypothetical protein
MARFDSADIENFIDQVEQMAAGAGDVLDPRPLLRGGVLPLA